MDKIKAAKQAIQKAGGIKAVAKRIADETGEPLNVVYERVKKWRQKGVAPLSAIQMERWSGVSRSLLAPDYYPASEYLKAS